MINRIKELREKIFQTQSNFATFLGTTRQAISKYETGENTLKVESLKLLLDKHSININWLLSNIGSMYLEDKSNSKETVDFLQKENERLKAQIEILKELINKK